MSGENTCGNYLIYTEPLVSEIRDYLRDTDQQDEEERQWNIGYNAGLYHAIRKICFTPAVDAVEVVRCSRCVNNPQIGTRTKGMVWCRKFMSEVRPDGYCSYSERREDNAVD